MEILVIRHAIAVDRQEGASEAADAARPLTSQGRRRFRQAVRGLDRLGLTVERVLHSPWLRAVQTADLLGPVVEGNLADCRRSTAHLTGSPKAELLAELATAGVPRLAVVGHEPWLSELIAVLTVSAANLHEAVILKKGGVAWLEGTPTPGGMHLRALLPPRVLRKVR